jgi:hypothetical protein
LYDRHTDLVWRATLSRSAAGGLNSSNRAATDRRGSGPLRLPGLLGCKGGSVAPPSENTSWGDFRPPGRRGRGRLRFSAARSPDCLLAAAFCRSLGAPARGGVQREGAPFGCKSWGGLPEVYKAFWPQGAILAGFCAKTSAGLRVYKKSRGKGARDLYRVPPIFPTPWGITPLKPVNL